jgi:hypothetical protein
MRDLRALALTSVPLPGHAKRLVWKVEAHAGLVNDCQLYEERG